MEHKAGFRWSLGWNNYLNDIVGVVRHKFTDCPPRVMYGNVNVEQTVVLTRGDNIICGGSARTATSSATNE